MSPPRSLLKFACRAILAVGLAAAALILIATVAVNALYGGNPSRLMMITMALFYAAGIAAAAVFISGVLGLLISIDERLEQLVNKAGGM